MTNLVDRTPVVGVRENDVLGFRGLEMNHWHRHKQHLRVLLGKHIILGVPTRAVEKEAIHVAPVGSTLRQRVSVLAFYLERPSQCVDGHCVFAREVLQRACKKGLSEVETWQPEHGRSPVVNPGLQESQAADKVVIEGAQRLE